MALYEITTDGGLRIIPARAAATPDPVDLSLTAGCQAITGCTQPAEWLIVFHTSPGKPAIPCCGRHREPFREIMRQQLEGFDLDTVLRFVPI